MDEEDNNCATHYAQNIILQKLLVNNGDKNSHDSMLLTAFLLVLLRDLMTETAFKYYNITRSSGHFEFKFTNE